MNPETLDMINPFFTILIALVNRIHPYVTWLSGCVRFAQQTYTTTDIALLAAMSERYDTPSGGVVKKLCERAYSIF
jgi:hypothetical protein